MRKQVILILLAAFFSLLSFTYAQNRVTFPTKVVNGSEYYVYTVQAGEGLYSISKRFSVSQSEINNVNPQIQNGLHAGEVILIPKKGQIIQPSKDEEPVAKVEYIEHKVQKKQTIFAISRIYNVSQEDILAANPGAANGIHEGDILQIPQSIKDGGINNNKTKKEQKEQKDENRPKKESPKESEKPNTIVKKEEPKAVLTAPNASTQPNNNSQIIYDVQQGETLYSISRRFKVTVDDIVKLNPGADTGLKAGSQLKIPGQSNAYANEAKINALENKIKTPEKKDTYKIAFLLPFMLDEKASDPTVYKFMDFYMGSLMAIKTSRNEGVNYEIFTFDTEKSESKLYSVINSPEMRKMDLIIGPAYSAQIPILADFAKRREIYTLIPFSSNVDDIEDNPYIIQFNPDKELQSYFIVSVLKNNFIDANVIMADIDNDKTPEEAEYFNIIAGKLNRSNIIFTKLSDSELSDGGIEKFLSGKKKNIIIFNTYKYSEVKPYLSDLYEIGQKYDLGVIGQYAWKNESGKKPRMYYTAPFKDDEQRAAEAVDYESQFSLYYGKLRGEKNPRYDMIGFDLTKYFISLMTKEGFSLEQTKNLKAYGIQSDMLFRRVNGNGGFMNQKLFLIEDAPKRN